MARILVADYDAAFSAVLKDYLQARGHQVAIAADGVQASLKAQEIRPDIILMDIMMPGVYGTSAYKSLEAAGITRATPVIFVTAVELERVVKVVPQGPLTRLMRKPIHFPELESVMAEFLAR